MQCKMQNAKCKVQSELLLTNCVWLLLLVVSCGHAPGHCILAAIPLGEGAEENALAAAAQRVDSPCGILSAEELRGRLPADLRSLDEAERTALAARVVDGQRLYAGEDIEAGGRILVEAFARYRERPELLPQAPEERGRVYRALLAALRVSAMQDPGSEQLLCDWLASHLPDQSPTVKLLPPVLEAKASDAVERAAAAAVPTSFGRPAGGPGQSRLFIDGRDAGPLPARELRLPPGEHAVWYECAGRRSWVRVVRIGEAGTDSVGTPSGEKVSSPGPRSQDVSHGGNAALQAEPALENGVRLSPADISVTPGQDRDLLERAAGSLRVSFGVDGVILVPEGNEDRAVLAAGHGAWAVDPILPPAAGQPPRYSVARGDLEPGFDWMLAGEVALISAGAGLLGMGIWANEEHNNEIAAMDGGLTDRRTQAARWKDLSIGSYAGAGAAFAAAAALVALDLMTAPEEPRPLF